MMKKTLVVAVVASFAGVAMAEMSAMDDSALSAVAGQDGVAIIANLSLHVNGVTYTDTDGSGGSFTFGDITATGLVAATIDILASNAAELNGDANGTFAGTDTVNSALNDADMGVPVGSDVVRIGVPQLGIANDNVLLLNVSIGDMTMGGGASFGSLSVSGINPQGTTVYIAAKD